MPSTTKAKSTIVAQFVRLARRERLSYDEFSYVCQQARKHLGLTKPQRARKLPHLLTADELTRFFRAVREGGNVQHEIMLKLLFCTAVRVAKNRFVFETQRCGPYTIRRVQQIVQRYREAAGLGAVVSPHLFRHQMLTFLTGQKLSDAQIQLLSGHASKKSLEMYQHLSLDAVEEAYQQAVKWLEM